MKKTITRISAILMLLVMLVSAFAVGVSAEGTTEVIENFWQTNVQVKAIATATAPTVDGNGNDAVWENALALTVDGSTANNIVYSNLPWVSGESVTVKLLWDDTALYILETHVDTALKHNSPAGNTADGAGVKPWEADGTIYGLQPIDSLPNETQTFMFMTTLADESAQPNGGMKLRTSKYGTEKAYVQTPSALSYKASTTADGWQMEVKLPWSIIREYYPNFSVAAGTYMGFRLSMYDTDGTATSSAHLTDKSTNDHGTKANKYPVLVLANSDGTVPDIDRVIGTVEIDYADDPDETPVIFDSETEAVIDDTAAAPTDSEAVSEDGGEEKKSNTGLIVTLIIVMVLAVGGAVAVIIFLKKKVIRIVAGALAVVIVIGCIIGMATSGKDESTEDTTGNTVVTRTEGDETMPDSNVPADLRFDGQDVNILIRAGESVNEFQPEYTGAIIDNAVYDRNLLVEDRLGVKLNFIPNSLDAQTAYLEHIRNTINSGLSGEEAYDIITSYAYYGAGLASEGLYYDLNSDSDKNYIVTDTAWYNQSFVTENTFGGKLYFVVGDMALSATDRIVVTFFNNNIMKDHGLGDLDLYQVALDGDWTLEYVHTLAKDVYENLDNDNESNDKDDLYGLSFNYGSMCVDSMWAALNIRIISRDADGNLEYTLNTHRNNSAYSELYDFVSNSVAGIRINHPKKLGNDVSEYYGTNTQYMSDQMFYEGRAMMSFGTLVSARVFSTSEAELSYGILPLPKYDKAQQGYYTTPHDAYSLISLPVNIGNRAELATATLEIMAEESYRTVRPAYYETAYKVRYASDDNTAQLFDMIIDNITYNFGVVNSASLGDPVWKLRDAFCGTYATPVKELSTIWATYKNSFNTKLDALVDLMS